MATKKVKHFLNEQGLQEEELLSCDLALTEACNNAVQYVQVADRQRCIKVDVCCTETLVELRIKDHTLGFNWPDKVALPEPEQESGRGIFFIQSAMDHTSYLRGIGENTLVMQKDRRYWA